MIKLALIGDTEVKNYSVSDRLWELISIVIDKRVRFSVIPLGSPTELFAAFDIFRKDRSFIGFEVSPPWRGVVAEWADKLEEGTNPSAVSIVYKDKAGSIVGADIGPRAAQRALESEINLYRCKSVLVIGSSGTGIPNARHLHDNLDKKTYLYDPLSTAHPNLKGVKPVSSLDELMQREYDLIINATPLGRHYFDKRVEAFSSPLDLDMLSHITHKDTVVQEINHLPGTTLLLQMARHLQLKVVTGELTLVYEAVEALKRYIDLTLDENTVHVLVGEIGTYIAEREAAILKQSI